MPELPMPQVFEVSTSVSAPQNADTSSAQPADQIRQPDFITTASLATFAGGSAAVTITWKVAIAIFGWSGRWFPGIVAAALGVYFFLNALETMETKTASKVMGVAFVSLVNACVLWAAAVGIDTGLDSADVATSSASG